MKNNKNYKKTPQKKNNNMILAVVAAVVVGIAAFTFINPKDEKANSTEQKESAQAATLNAEGNIVIPIADISEKATFYSYNELSSNIEFLAVKASDGTIRTAFNTCQVCYSSGRGYYVQEGNVLVCQNCGNRFNMDEVEVTRGGCNPVPIFEEVKETTDTSIIISKEAFKEAETIFANWKN